MLIDGSTALPIKQGFVKNLTGIEHGMQKSFLFHLYLNQFYLDSAIYAYMRNSAVTRGVKQGQA